MRTTLVLEDDLVKKIRRFIPGKGISGFVNSCIRAYFAHKEDVEYLKSLEAAYARANEDELIGDGIATEDWPEW